VQQQATLWGSDTGGAKSFKKVRIVAESKHLLETLLTYFMG
jgi:hypothetical protein